MPTWDKIRHNSERATDSPCGLAGTVYFTPTFALWLNQLERFLTDLTEKPISCRVYRSIVESEQAIIENIEPVEENPKPF